MALRFIIEADKELKSKLWTVDFAPKMRFIDYVNIGGKYYRKPKKDSVKIQNYYIFLIANRDRISKLKLKNGDAYYLYGGKLHSYRGSCFYTPPDEHRGPQTPKYNEIYAIKGKLMTKKDFVIYNRKFKVEKLKERIK